MENIDVIKRAISKRLTLKFEYEGMPRIVEPFTLGYHNTTNNLSLSAYRVGGYTRSHNSPPWRLYDVSKIRNIEILNNQIDPNRKGYNPRDERLSRIICTI